MTSLADWRHGREPRPRTMLRWHLYGAGLDALGASGQPETVPVPEPGPHEILVRQDACGLCFSDTKVIALGREHPRMAGRDLATNPVTLGHEVVCTVVATGEEVAHRFTPGERYVVQADVFYHGVSVAYGYVFRGGLAGYSIIPRELLDGDEGCYLLPVRDDTGYVAAALTEPWACVVAAYVQPQPGEPRRSGGRLLVLNGGGDSAPRLPAQHLAGATVINATDWEQTAAAGAMYDDIWVTGPVAPEAVEGIAPLLAPGGVMNFIAVSPFGRPLSLDVGRIHYDRQHYVGTPTTDPADSLAASRDAELVPGGSVWFIGAAGPMGQMHVQRALEMPAAPAVVFATDVSEARLAELESRCTAVAGRRGIRLVCANPASMEPAAADALIRELTGGRGFDDIVSMVPSAAVLEDASRWLAPGGWFNIFAGVARGTRARVDVNAIVQRRVRYIGSSGSSLADMRETLERVEDGSLATESSLAAIGGMRAARDGLAAVRDGTFAGKTVIFPGIPDLPLTALAGLGAVMPSVHERLADGKRWTAAAEQELLRIALEERQG